MQSKEFSLVSYEKENSAKSTADAVQERNPSLLSLLLMDEW